jgi:hypothetical protein
MNLSSGGAVARQPEFHQAMGRQDVTAADARKPRWLI